MHVAYRQFTKNGQCELVDDVTILLMAENLKHTKPGVTRICSCFFFTQKPATSAVTKPAGAKPAAAKSSFAEFRRKMQQQKKVESPEVSATLNGAEDMVTADVAETVGAKECGMSDVMVVVETASGSPTMTSPAQGCLDTEKTFDGGFYQVISPVRSSHSTPDVTRSKGRKFE